MDFIRFDNQIHHLVIEGIVTANQLLTESTQQLGDADKKSISNVVATVMIIQECVHAEIQNDSLADNQILVDLGKVDAAFSTYLNHEIVKHLNLDLSKLKSLRGRILEVAKHVKALINSTNLVPFISVNVGLGVNYALKKSDTYLFDYALISQPDLLTKPVESILALDQYITEIRQTDLLSIAISCGVYNPDASILRGSPEKRALLLLGIAAGIYDAEIQTLNGGHPEFVADIYQQRPRIFSEAHYLERSVKMGIEYSDNKPLAQRYLYDSEWALNDKAIVDPINDNNIFIPCLFDYLYDENVYASLIAYFKLTLVERVDFLKNLHEKQSCLLAGTLLDEDEDEDTPPLTLYLKSVRRTNIQFVDHLITYNESHQVDV